MITRLQHRKILTAPQAEKNINNEPQKPIYDAIAQALQKWNVLSLKKSDDLTFENVIVWLLQHLPEAHDLHSVESLVFEIFAKQQEYRKFTPEQSLMMKFLADDIFQCWNQYLQRNEPSSFSQARFKALMSRHHSPRTHSR